MSALLMGLVWGIELTPAEQTIMLALADHGKDDGTDIYPSVAMLAWKSGRGERQVQRLLRDLERKRLIIAVAHAQGGRGHATRYEMHLENGTAKSPFKREELNDEPVTGDISDHKRVTFPTEPVKGDISDHKRVTFPTIKGDIAMSPEPYEPSYEPDINSTVVVNPSHAHAHARETAAAALWNQNDLAQTTARIAEQFKLPRHKHQPLQLVIAQYPPNPTYLLAQAGRCWEHYTDPRTRKTITVSLFDEWMGRAEARRLQLLQTQQNGADNGSQGSPAAHTETATAAGNAAKRTSRERAAEARALAAAYGLGVPEPCEDE